MPSTPSLATTLFRVPRTEGLELIQQRGAGGARQLTTHRLTLGAGQTATFATPDEETVVVLQRGAGRFSCDAHSWDVAREDVFSATATALLLPPGRSLLVTATTPLEALLVRHRPSPVVIPC